MTVTLNHTIVVARDAEATAKFVTDLLGLPPAKRLGHFVVVQVGETSLDYVSGDGEIQQRHFAFLASEEEFDEGLDRMEKFFRRFLGIIEEQEKRENGGGMLPDRT